MKVAVLSANLGNYEAPTLWPTLQGPPGVDVMAIRLTDRALPPRPKAMTSRLQAGIPKWFGTDFAVADVIIWVDASCTPTSCLVPWFLERLHGEIAVFAHPERQTINQEFRFIVERMKRPGETYLTSRYAGEDFHHQFQRIHLDDCADLPLYASTAFAYRTTPRMVKALREVFLWKARYLLHDQLAFPWVLHQHGCQVSVIHENYLKCEALTFTRKRRAA